MRIRLNFSWLLSFRDWIHKSFMGFCVVWVCVHVCVWWGGEEPRVKPIWKSHYVCWFLFFKSSLTKYKTEDQNWWIQNLSKSLFSSNNGMEFYTQISFLLWLPGHSGLSISGNFLESICELSTMIVISFYKRYQC